MVQVPKKIGFNQSTVISREDDLVFLTMIVYNNLVFWTFYVYNSLVF